MKYVQFIPCYEPNDYDQIDAEKYYQGFRFKIFNTLPNLSEKFGFIFWSLRYRIKCLDKMCMEATEDRNFKASFYKDNISRNNFYI